MLLVFFMWIWDWSNRNVLKCIILSEKKRKKKPSLRNQNKSNIFLNKGRKEGVEGVKKEKRLLLTVFLNWMKTSQFIKKKNLSSVIPLIPLKIQTFLLKLHWNWGITEFKKALQYVRTQNRTSQMNRHIGDSLGSFQIQSFCVLGTWNPPSTSIWSPARKLHWALVSRVFTEVSLCKGDWLNHWPHD